MVLEAFLISLVMMVAAGFSTITGFGISTISIPILLFFFPLPQALLFVVIMRIVSSLWKILLIRDGLAKSLILMIGIPAIFASFLGANTVLFYSKYISRQVLGVFLLFYVVFIFLKPHFKLSKKSAVTMGGGALTGFSAGVFGISGPLQSAFLSSFDLPKFTYIFTTAFLDFLIDVPRVSVYLTGGIKLMPILLLSLLFSIPTIFLGVFFARRIVHGIPQIYFRYVILIFLGIVGARWLIWG